jgi:hypothetical protein
MPSRLLIHIPSDSPSRVVDSRRHGRPAGGEESPPGSTGADHTLVAGDFEGEDYAYEVRVVPCQETA